MIQQIRPWEGQLAEIEERRSRKAPKQRVIVKAPGLKGKPPKRKCPDDFDVIFVEIGRLDCETWYRAGRIMVNRWLAERGKERLIKARAAYVRFLRGQGKTSRRAPAIQVRTDRRRVSPELAAMAAAHLRVTRNGGWRVSPTGQGDWFVGSARKSAREMLVMAEAKGFDTKAANLQIKARAAVEDGNARPA